MMLRWGLGLHEEADAVETAVSAVLDAGYRTVDLANPGETAVGTQEMGDLVAKAML
jgi:3-isopropylmalate dehydrogenase